MTMPTNIGHVMNLANSIIGVSLLAMPFCFKQCGITLAIIMLILSSIISRLACHFLVKSSTMCRRRNFEFLAFYTFGPSGKLLVELGVIGFMMGTCVAFFVVMGDLGPAIISKIFNINNDGTLRTTVLLSIGVLVVLPLGLLRNVESLASISMITVGFYLLFILKIFFESSPHLISGDWWYHVNFWQPEGVLQCIPIFAMALSCQTQVFEIYESLPMPTIEKMNSVVHSALNLCTIVYTSVGFLGYIAYFKGTFTGNVLLSFTPSLSSEMFKLGFVMSIALSFPLVIFPCRASLYSLIFRRVPVHHELSQTSMHIPDSRFKCLTIAIIAVALITGLLIPSIEIVLGFLGSTIGIAICVIFPSLSFLNLNNKRTNERIIAKVTFLLGLLIMIMGTFGNLFPAVEDNSLDSSASKSFGVQELPQVVVPIKAEVKTDSMKKQNKGDLLKNPVISEKLPPDSLKNEVYRLNPVEPTSKLSKENRRQEPPIPVAPALKSKEHNIDSPSFLKLNEGKKKVKIEEDFNKKTQIVDNKEMNLPEHKQNEVINKDAIEKEEREIMEVEKQKKTEEDEKQEELLKVLREHQNEQKKLLREQEKILNEMKQRESEKKLNEVVKKKIVSKEANSYLNDIKPIKSDEFKDGINKIQNVIDELRDGKEKEITNNKSSFISLNLNISNQKREDNKAVNEVIEVKSLQTVELPKVLQENKSSLNNNSIISVPLPLAKQMVEIKASKVENSKKSPSLLEQEILLKDNLAGKSPEKVLDREKRDAKENEREVVTEKTDIENCVKDEVKNDHDLNETDKVNISDSKSKKTPQESLFDKQTINFIKNSEHLSIDGDEKKPTIVQMEHSKMIPDILNEPLISKKRDLKSVNTRDHSYSR